MVAAAAPSAPVVLVAFAVAGLGIANTVPIMFSAAGNHPGMASGAALSTVTIGYSGILVAPSSIGFVAEHIGFRWTYGALALLLLAVAALAGLVRAADAARHWKRVSPASAAPARSAAAPAPYRAETAAAPG